MYSLLPMSSSIHRTPFHLLGAFYSEQMSNPAIGTLRAGARPNPPGRPAGPGQAMPRYQGLPAARWDAASRGVANAPTPPTISAHMGDEANKPVHSSQPVLPWPMGEQMLIRQGQIAFLARTNPRTDTNNPWAGYSTCATMQHINAMAQAGWSRARHKLQLGPQYLPDGIRLSLDEFDSLREDDIMDYFGKREEDIPDDAPLLKAACKLLHQAEFKYLLPGTMLMYWNWYGSVNNIRQAIRQFVYGMASLTCAPNTATARARRPMSTTQQCAPW